MRNTASVTTNTNQDNNSLVHEVLAEHFSQEVEQFQGRVLIDFYAPWCGPCKMISPIMEQIAQEHPALKVIKINADNSQELMSRFGIRGIPTLLLISHGEVVATKVGAASMSQIKAFVEQV